MSDPSILLYGATGYTGRLISQAAVARDVRIVLAGRNAVTVRALAETVRLPHRAFGLEDRRALNDGLAGVGTVLHCAGPFSATSAPMATACLQRGAHYLDITGEIGVFEALAARRDEARRSGVVLLPGVGFDVVPSDSLAAHLARRLPSATHLELAIAFLGGVSRGTAATMLEALARGEGTVVRREGRLQAIATGSRSMEVDLGEGLCTATAVSWGDVVTAYHSTGIPNIDVYMAFSGAQRHLLRLAGPLTSLLRVPGATSLARQAIRMREPGPDERARAAGRGLIWGRVRDAAGRRAAARMRTPEGYAFTARSALWAAEEVAAGRVSPGFHTPTTAFGVDVALAFEGVERFDLPEAST